MVTKTSVIKSLVAVVVLFLLYELKNSCSSGSNNRASVRQIHIFPSFSSEPVDDISQDKSLAELVEDWRGSNSQESLSHHQKHFNFSDTTTATLLTKYEPHVNQKRKTIPKLKNESQVLKYHPAPPLPAEFHPLLHQDIDDVEKFVFFIGYGRSGHSMVASIMDAHPNVIVAHEFYLFDKLSKNDKNWTKKELYNTLYLNSYTSTLNGWRANKNTSKGYNLNLRGSWQGQFRKLRVIGDKTAGATAMLFHESRGLFRATVRRVQNISGATLRAIHVVRNPYDMIATVALYKASPKPNQFKVAATKDKPFKDAHQIQRAVINIFNKAQAVSGISKLRDFQLLEIHLEDLIKNSQEVILKICRFLEITCDEEYIKICQAKIYSHASQSRHLVVWSDYTKAAVQKMIKSIPFFSRYSFEN